MATGQATSALPVVPSNTTSGGQSVPASLAHETLANRQATPINRAEQIRTRQVIPDMRARAQEPFLGSYRLMRPGSPWQTFRDSALRSAAETRPSAEQIRAMIEQAERDISRWALLFTCCSAHIRAELERGIHEMQYEMDRMLEVYRHALQDLRMLGRVTSPMERPSRRVCASVGSRECHVRHVRASAL